MKSLGWLVAGGAGLFVLTASHPRTSSPIDAQVRFANYLTGKGTWNVDDNGKTLFTGVTAGTKTAYVSVADTVSHLILARSGPDTIRATTNYQFVAGSYYTITADYRSGGNLPVLSVMRDRPPGDMAPPSP